MKQAIIMAGGKGTRLTSITKDEIPKPMVPVLGKPLLERQIIQLRKNGVEHFTIVTGHLGDVITSYFGNGSKWNVKIDYFQEQQPLGSAGALAYLHSKISDPFFLAFGDVLFDIDLTRMESFHNRKKAIATLFVHPNSHPYDSDLIITDDNSRVIGFDKKGEPRQYWYDNCVNAGLYILDPFLCMRIQEGKKTDMEQDVLSPAIDNHEAVYAYHSPEYVKDIGTVDRIKQAEEELRAGTVGQRALRSRQKAIFLDRDGVINKENGLIFKEDQFELEPCAAEAIRLINQSGYLAMVVTNQPVVARGLCEIKDVELIHRKMKTLLGKEGAYIDDIRFCPHHPDKGFPGENTAYKIDCHCRKPDIGMFEELSALYNIDLQASWMIGDRTTDIMAGKNASTHTMLVMTGEGGRDGKCAVQPDATAENLLKAVQKILEI